MTDVLTSQRQQAPKTRSVALSAISGAPPHLTSGPRTLETPPGALIDPSAAAMRYLSPLRYPGAKSGLAPLIAEIVKGGARLLGRPQMFVEPFAGGASAALRLVADGIVDRVLLADADPLVARFWQVAAADPEWLVDRMHDEPVTLERWDYWRGWTPKNIDDREIAVKCLFLNRTTFSGILHGRAGPIGGRAQSGPYLVDCRFNKERLERRLRFIGDLYRAGRLVDVWCKDWEATLADVAENYPQLVPDRVIAYLDPPYLRKSAKLYGRSFDPSGGYGAKSRAATEGWGMKGWQHLRVAEYLRRRATYRWLLSYDDEPELLTSPALYAAQRMTPSAEEKALLGVKEWRITKRLVEMRYSAGSARSQRGRNELLLTTLPSSSVPLDGRLRTPGAAC